MGIANKRVGLNQVGKWRWGYEPETGKFIVAQGYAGSFVLMSATVGMDNRQPGSSCADGGNASGLGPLPKAMCQHSSQGCKQPGPSGVNNQYLSKSS